MNHELKIWEKLGVGATSYPLPIEIVSQLKKSLSDDMQALKYVVFNVCDRKKESNGEKDLESILATIDTARQYHLTSHEMREACDRFVNCKQRFEKILFSKNGQSRPKRRESTLLPEPKVGSIFFRKDKRRRSCCKVVAVEDGKATVMWAHSGRKTNIAVLNLRNPSLYATKKGNTGCE